ncbi:MAG: transporter substrate-binding domain-containing protein [Clostridia bacterium]|nr:transporter substrate-binding domain-containing protein [Clostridia bacterium]
MKKLLSLLLVICSLCLCLGLTACGSTEPKVKLIDVKLTDENYAFVLKKGNTELKDDFNAYLAEIKENGTFDAIVAKYFEGVGEKIGYTVATDYEASENTAENFVVATNCPFEPFEYIQVDGKIYGIDMEIAAGYAESKGLNLVIKNIPDFDAIFTQVQAGYADIGMAGITITETRLESYDFTETYYAASQKIIVAADCTDFDACETVEDVEAVLAALEGKSIGYQTGTTGNWYVVGDEDWGYDGFANVTSKGYKTAQLAVTDLINGNLYAVVVDEAPAAALVNAFNK